MGRAHRRVKPWACFLAETRGAQMADPNVLKQYIFQKGFVTEATKQKRQQEAANSTLQVRTPPPAACRTALCYD